MGKKSEAKDSSLFMLASIQVIIPALDEEETIGGVLKELRELGLTRLRVMDNGSRDATAQVARDAGAEVMLEPKAGYGQACWSGYQQLDDEVEWVLFCDADGSDDLADITRMVAAVAGGAEFVLGDRRARLEGRSVMTPVQHFGNGLATTLIRMGWGQKYGDLGPLRLIKRSLLEKIAMEDRGFGWTIEMQVRAVEAGARIVELPVGYKRRGGGRSKISGTVRGSVAAGTIILATIGKLWALKWNCNQYGYKWGAVLVLLGAGLMMPWGGFAEAGTVPWFLSAAAVMAAGWLLAGTPKEMSWGWFWAVAVGARVLLFPMEPGDDIWRYLWEGRMQGSGFSPYLHSPSDPLLAPWRDETWALINHPEASAIYPPLAQIGLRMVAAISVSVGAFKIVFVVADLAVAGLLARRFGRGAAIWYAWNPLVIYVGAGGAHYEPVLVWAMVAGWLGWEAQEDDDGRLWQGAWWLGVAAGLKWITAPLLAWAVWAKVRAGQWQRAVGLSVLGAAPVLLGLLWFSWDFGRIGPLAPKDFVSHARTAELFPWLVELGWPESAYKNRWMVVFFAPVAAWVFFRAKSMREFGETFLVALLVFSPSVHAWYFVWLVPFAVASRNLGIRLVSVSAFSYFWLWETQARTGVWEQSIVERVILWLPLLAGFAWTRMREKA